MNRLVLLVSLALAAAGCAGASSSRSASGPTSGLATVNENGDKVICRMERPIGSNIAEMVCRTQATAAAQRQASQDAMRGMPKSGASPASN